MLKAWRRRLLWGSVLALAASSYSACAWLWSAPYRPKVAPDSAVAGARAVATPEAPTIVPPAPSTSVALATPAAPIVVQPARTPAFTNTRNLLVIGLDRRPDGSGPALADSLLVVVMDDATRHVGVVSIPRDLYVDIPGSATDRINTVYMVAKRSKRDPLELMSRVVSDTLKLPIAHAVVLDLGVFERAVDAVGGVDVDVPCAVSDNFVDSREPGGRRALDVDPGLRHFDGATAAMYARSRHGRSDFHRARRQQQVLLGVQHALSGLGALKVPELWSAFEESVETDLKRYQLLDLGRRAVSLDPSHLHGLVIGAEHVQGVHTADGKAVLLPNYDAIDASLAKLFSAPSPGVRPQGAPCEPKGAALGPS